MKRTSFVQGLASSLSPGIEDIGNLIASNILKNKEEEKKQAKQREQQQALVDLLRGGSVNQGIQPVSNTGLTQAGTPQELGAYGDVLQPYSNEEKALRYSLIGNEGQQAYNLYQKLRAPKKAPKYYDVKGDTGINESTGLREKIGGVSLPKESTLVYDPTQRYVLKQDPITKELTPTNIPNVKFKKPTREQEIKRAYDPKTDKMRVEIGTFEEGATEPLKTDIRYLDVKDSGVGGSKLKKEIIADLSSQEKDVIKLKNSLSQKVTGVKTDENGNLVLDTPKGRISLNEYEQGIKKQLWERSDALTNVSKSMLSEKGKAFLRDLYNQEAIRGGQVVKKKGEKPNQKVFDRSLIDYWKEGKIDEADYKLLQYYRTGTYHGIEE